MKPEPVLRWGTTLTALAALVALAVTLGTTVAPALAWSVVLAVSAALTVSLWRRHLDEQAVRAEVRAVRTSVPPEVGKY